MVADKLEQGRASFRRQAWSRAYQQLAQADAAQALEPADLELLAVAAHLVGRDQACDAAFTRAHHAYAERGAPRPATRCAFWLGLTLFLRGEEARGGGWIARAARLLQDDDGDCAEQGYLLIPDALQRLHTGAPADAQALFTRAAQLGERFGEPDLRTLARLGEGQALVRLGRHHRAAGALDEAMVAVEAREVSALVAGIVYCAVILSCLEMLDVRRAQQWTAALDAWCRSQPDLVRYRGQCLVHRSELLQLGGHWTQAMQEAQRACARLSDPPGQPALGMAYYQRAELHRLRGELVEAEQAYEVASRHGHSPQPGLALLRLAQGRTGDAEAAIRRMSAEDGHGPGSRARLLAAGVRILLAAGAVEDARSAAAQLAALAAGRDAPLLDATCATAEGALRLATGDLAGAAASLGRAREAWEALPAPYEAARTRVLLAEACRRLGDADSARLELQAARVVFQRLGARPDLARVDDLLHRRRADAAPLTARELDVIRLVAAGRTNRQIAGALVISEKTVARHLNNVFTKLGLANRAAATAYAYEHGLV